MARMLMAVLLLFQAGCAAALAGDGPSGRDYILAIYSIARPSPPTGPTPPSPTRPGSP